ncbi:hypothetical protein AAGV28_14095 [Flavobacterium sp. FZUC8N2.13]|uniref:Glycine zipper n=1 Tax=Flavobacterium zubiriense TaxID=3138075 RepID=A0ABV4TEF0_9FLAO
MLFIPGTQIIGGALLLNGLSYFKSTYDQYKVTGDWGTASKNSSIMFGYKIDTDWGYDNDKKNGVNQNEPVIKPKSDTSGGGKDKEGNTSTILDIGGGIFGALETTATPGNQWLGKNGKYYNNSWGGNQYTGSRAGAYVAASNYKWAGGAALGAGVLLSGIDTYNAYQLDGKRFGYNAQRAAVSATGGIIGGWAGAEAGAYSFGIIGGMIGGPPGAAVGAIAGGFIGGFGGGYFGGFIGGRSVNFYHNR